MQCFALFTPSDCPEPWRRAGKIFFRFRGGKRRTDGGGCPTRSDDRKRRDFRGGAFAAGRGGKGGRKNIRIHLERRKLSGIPLRGKGRLKAFRETDGRGAFFARHLRGRFSFGGRRFRGLAKNRRRLSDTADRQSFPFPRGLCAQTQSDGRANQGDCPTREGSSESISCGNLSGKRGFLRIYGILQE